MSTMLFKNSDDNVKPLYKYLNILPLRENIKLLQRKFMWKFLTKKQSDFMIKQFPFRFNKPINNTNREKLPVPSVGKNSLLYQEYKTWNLEIPANTQNKESYNNSAKSYHKYLLNGI